MLSLSVANLFKFSFKSVHDKLLIRSMSQALEAVRKNRYNGKVKKRKWEERRSDFVQDATTKVAKLTESGERVKRRKFVLLMGYLGANYYGMQRNPLMPTIEEELFKALLATEHINEEEYNQAQQIQFQRAARTDKGVSAARQVVSLKLYEDCDITKINAHMPDFIRVFGLRRVTKGFNSKSQCDSRTYMYMLPTISFADHTSSVDQESYRMSPELLQRVNDLLQNYLGTKNFFNFTSKRAHNDPSVRRYIISFVCETPFVRNNVEFAVMKVQGQSFMLHQIRKMIGLIIAIIRGHIPEEMLTTSLETTERVNVPKAPGLGLVLDFPHYERYNYRYEKTHAKLLWEEEEPVVNAFKEKYIYPTIVDTEITEKSMVEWLGFLYRHDYENLEDNDPNDTKDNEEDDDNDDQDDLDEDQDKNDQNLDEDKSENKAKQ